MKQHITIEQLKELKGKTASKYVDWMVKRGYDFSKPLSIGQMIEFLLENEKEDQFLHESFPWDEDLCDDLWEAVKEVLNGSDAKG